MDVQVIKHALLKIKKAIESEEKVNNLENFLKSECYLKVRTHLDSIVKVLYEVEMIYKCYTERSLYKKIFDVIISYPKSQQDFFSELDNIISGLVKDLTHKDVYPITYFVFIDHLTVEEDFSIGNTMIVGHNSSRIDELSDKFDSNMEAPNVHTNGFIKAVFRSKIKPSISIAVFESDGIEIEQTKRIGLYETRLVINVIRLFYFSRTGQTLSHNFNYFGISGYTYNRDQFVHYTTSEPTTNIEIKSGSLKMPYNLDRSFFKERLSELNKISEIVSKSSKSELEKLLISSIDFFGEGVNDFITKYAFLNFFVSLENLLLLTKESHITQNLATRTALLLGDNAKEKQLIQSEIVDLYDIRSALVHKGKDFVEYDNLLRIGSYVNRVIFTILNKIDKYNDQISLVSHLNQLDLDNDIKFLDIR